MQLRSSYRDFGGGSGLNLSTLKRQALGLVSVEFKIQDLHPPKKVRLEGCEHLPS